MAGENELIVKLTALGEEFQAGIDNAMGAFGDLLGALTRGNATFALVSAGAVAAGGALFGLAKATANYGDELLELSDKTGMSVEDLSLLKYAAERGETSLEGLANGVKFMQKALVEAQTGNEKAAASFRALGLDLEQIVQLPVKERLLLMADALKGVEDPALRSTLALDVFGKSGADLLPLMMKGSEGIREMMTRGDELGLKMSTETAKQADEFNDSLRDLWDSVKQIGYDIGALLLPPLRWLFEVLVNIVSFIKNTFYATIHAVNVVFLSLAGTAAGLVNVLTTITDALHLTSGASKKTKEWVEQIGLMAKEAGKSTAESFTKAIGAITGQVHAEEELANTKGLVKRMTDEERRAELNRAEAAKKAAEEQKRLHKEYLDGLENVLDTKRKLKEFDQGYFDTYEAQLRATGKAEEDIAALVAAEKKRIHEQEFKTFKMLQHEMVAVAKAVADGIKGLWSDQETSLRDVWKRALDGFVDIMSSMVTNAVASGQTISQALQQSMTSYSNWIVMLIQLVVNYLSYMSSRAKNAKRQAEEDLRRLKELYQAINSEYLEFIWNLYTSGEKIADVNNAVAQSLQKLSAMGQNTYTSKTGGATLAMKELDAMQDAIRKRYEVEKGLINDITNILKQQRGFVKSIDDAIRDVSRSGFSKEQILAAQGGDIATLRAALVGTAGDEKIDLLGQLRQAYLDYFGTAKDIYAAGSPELAAIQKNVLAGLQAVKAEGTAVYDELLKVNVQQLGVQIEGNNIARQVADFLRQREESYSAAMTGIAGLAQLLANIPQLMHVGPSGLPGAAAYNQEVIAEWMANYNQLLAPIVAAMNALQITSGGMPAVPAMASGGIVTRPTLAMIGEGGGAEAVIPLNRLEAMLGRMGGSGGGSTFNLSFPNIRDFRDITVAEARQLLQTTFRTAAEDLGRQGYFWALPSRA